MIRGEEDSQTQRACEFSLQKAFGLCRVNVDIQVFTGLIVSPKKLEAGLVLELLIRYS